MITLEQVEVAYRGETAVGPVSLHVPARRRCALIGPSGSGKSTLLRAIVGLVTPSRGRVVLCGETMSEATARALRHRVGYVIQEGGLFPHLTAAGNAALLARHLGWDQARIQSRLRELGAMTNLEPDLLGRYPSQLSGGQRQRVGIVRALMLDPDVLVLDEPLGALDPVTRARLQRELVALFDRLDKTVVIVTHDLAEAALLAEEVVILRAGKIAQRGSIAELVRSPADDFVAEFVAAQRSPGGVA